MAQGVHLRLSGGTLALIVGADDGVVLDPHHGHAVGRRPQVRIADLGQMPGGLGVRTLASRAALGGMDTGVGEPLVDVVETLDVPDLGDERGGDGGTDPRDGP